MNALIFQPLLYWELLRIWRKPVVWIGLLLLGFTMVFGAMSAATLHHSQTQAIAKNQIYTTDWYADIDARAKRYATSVHPGLPYWQDPTHVSGFSRYFLKQYAYKPHLPLSPLAVGSSDLLPSRLPVELETAFAVDPQYDFENPRALALGQFDLAFVIVYLLPITILCLCGLLATLERDNGALRFIAAQPVTPRSWLGARLLALFIYGLPSILFMLWLALWFANAPITDALPEFFTAIAVISAYALLWFAISFAVLSYWPTAVSAVGILIGIWVLVLIGAPLLLNIVISITDRSPSYITYVNETRHEQDLVNAQANEIIEKAFETHPLLAGKFDAVPTIDYATRLTFLAPELEQRLQATYNDIIKRQQQQQELSTITGYLAPGLGVINSLAILAGTNTERHSIFLQQTRAYQLQLRDMFYTRIYQQLYSPSVKPKGASGQFSFTAYEEIPEFSLQEASIVSQMSNVIGVIVWLLILSTAILLFTLRRLKNWPEDL